MKRLGIVLLSVLMIIGCKENKIGYVENAKVFDGFKATIEMKAKNEEILKERTMELDSLKVSLYKADNMLQDASISSKNKEVIVNQYLFPKSQYDSLTANIQKLIQELEYYTISKSWTEINKYIMEYGKENKFDMIHGVSGEGNLMYADEKLNVTDQVIEYMNNKYDGE